MYARGWPHSARVATFCHSVYHFLTWRWRVEASTSFAPYDSNKPARRLRDAGPEIVISHHAGGNRCNRSLITFQFVSHLVLARWSLVVRAIKASHAHSTPRSNFNQRSKLRGQVEAFLEVVRTTSTNAMAEDPHSNSGGYADDFQASWVARPTCEGTEYALY